MIRTLALRNWRAYKHAELTFAPGTTFIVAANGVGKSSLLEAARWAIFGDVVPNPETAMRLGAQETSARVELELPDRTILTVERILSRPRTRLTSRVAATLDGREVSESELTRLLEDMFKASPLFLSRTAFLTEDLRREDDPDIIGQLSRAFGIDDLRRAHQELTVSVRELSNSLKTARAEEAASAVDLTQAEDELLQAKQAEAAAQEMLNVARQQMSQASSVLRELELSLRDAEQSRSWEIRMGELRDLAEPFVGSAALSELAIALEDAEQVARDDLADLRGRRDLLRGKVATLEEGLEKLRSAEGVCPICRRPLSEEDRAVAEAGHLDELQQLHAEARSLEDENLQQHHEVLRGLVKRALALGERPQGSDVTAAQVAAASDQARAHQESLEQALRRHQAEQSRVNDLERRLASIRATLESSRALHAKYRELVLAETAQSAIDAAVSRALDHYITPMAQQVRTRWKHLFPDRPDLRIEPSGDLTRQIDGYDLPFEAFSAGEKTFAKLMLRLVTLTTATTARFCWIDEPLEHLDPTSRRLTAGILAQAGDASGIRQLVVTTFEEELARRLEKTRDDVHLLYVRTRAEV